MAYFQRSLFRKFLALLIGLTLAAFVFGILAWQLNLNAISLTWIFVILLFLFAAITFSFHLAEVVNPLQKLLRETKAMLTGQRYNRVYTDRTDEWAVFGYFFNEVSKSLERISAKVQEGERMSSELQLASDIQKRILPKKMPEVPGLDIYGSTRAAVEIGGDSYDFITVNNNTFIYVGDATGHGVPAGLLMMMVNTLVHTFAERFESGYDVLVQTNKQLKPRIQPTMFMTLALLRWQAADKQFYLTGAGHEHVLHYKKADNKCRARITGGIALGMVQDNSQIIKEERIPSETGDIIVLYSDGLIEARNTKGEMFGVERLISAVENYAPASKTSLELFTGISADFSAFAESQAQTDDITLMVIKRQA